MVQQQSIRHLLKTGPNSVSYGAETTPIAPGAFSAFSRTRPRVIASASRRGVFALAKLAVTSAFLLIIMRRINLSDLLDELCRAQAWPLFVALALLLTQFPLAGWRWRLVLRAAGAEANPIYLQNLVWIGQFVNQAMPTFVVGDVLRGWYLVQAKIPARAAFSSLILDRLIGLGGLLLLILVMSPLPLLSFEIGTGTAWTIIATAAVGCVTGAVGLVACIALLRAKVLSRWPRIEALTTDASQVVASPARLAVISILAVGTNVIASAAAYFVAAAFGIGLTMPEALALFPVALFAVLVPISIAGWGVREGVLVFLLTQVGIPPAQGFLLSVAYGLMTTGASLPGALIWLRSRD